MSDRSKVGRGNRKLVRQLLRENGIELPYGRDCVNGRYSLKVSPIINFEKNAAEQRDALLRKIRNVFTQSDVVIPGLEIAPTNRDCSYPRRPQYGVAIRFKDQ